MPSDSLLPLLDALLRLRRLDPAELESLLRQLPGGSADPQAAAKELLQRGWITAEQFASLCPGPPPEHQPARETVLIGFGDDDTPLDPEVADTEKWSLPTDEEPAPPPPPQGEPQPTATEPTSTPQPATPAPLAPGETEPKPSGFEWEELGPSPTRSKPEAKQDETDKQMRKVMAWSGKGLLVWLLFLASFFLGAWLLRPSLQSRSEPKSAARSPKSGQAGGERWWEGQPLDVDAVIAAEQKKAQAESSQRGKALSTGAPPSAAETKMKSLPPPNPEKPPPIANLKLPPGTVLLGGEDQPQTTALAFRDNYVVATGNQDGRLIFWDTEKGIAQHSWPGHRDRVNRLAFSAEGRCMVSAGNDRMVRVWNGTTRKEIRSWSCDALSLAISKDGRYVAAGCVDGVVRLTDLSSGESWSHPKDGAKGNQRSVSEPLSIAFSPDSSLLAIGYGTGHVQLVDLEKRKQTRNFVAHRMVYAVVFSPDGRVLATAGKDGTIKLWDIGSGKELRTMSDPGTQPVAALVYSHRTPYLAAGSWDGSVHLWHLGLVGTVRVIQTIRLPPAGFGQQIDLSPDGRLLGCVHGGNPACVIPVPP